MAGNRDTKGSHLSARYVPAQHLLGRQGPQQKEQIAEEDAVARQTDFYELLGVAEDCHAAELKAAHRRRTLESHPDKGGDQDQFDAIQHAFAVLSNDAKRDAYDAARARVDEAIPIQGGPTNSKSTKPEKVIVKTAPRVGSTRAKDWLRCAKEHDNERSGGAMVNEIRLALVDMERPAEGQGALTEEMQKKKEKELQQEQTEMLFKKFKELNPGMKKQWVATLNAKQRSLLKERAKEEEGKELAKAKKWASK